MNGEIIDWNNCHAPEQLDSIATTKNYLGVDAVSRKELLKIYEDRFLELQKLKHLKENKGAEDMQLGVNYCINILKELPSVTPQEPQSFKWCTDCKEYDQDKHCCHRYSKVIRDTVEEMKQEPKSEWEYDHAILKAYSDGANEALDNIRAEIEAKCCITVGRENDGAITLHDVFEIIDKYKGESEG